jgi:hypothetical protein
MPKVTSSKDSFDLVVSTCYCFFLRFIWFEERELAPMLSLMQRSLPSGDSLNQENTDDDTASAGPCGDSRKALKG